MNRYGYEVGVHKPELARLTKLAIEAATGLEFSCSSWHNDQVDSISNDDLNIQVFMPNSYKWDPDNEEYNTYSISSADGEHDDYVWHEIYTFEQIIELINTRKMTLENEKAKVMDDIQGWVTPIVEDETILTHDMLNAIIAKCNQLKKIDF